MRTRWTPNQGPRAGFSHFEQILHKLYISSTEDGRGVPRLPRLLPAPLRSSVSVGMRTPLRKGWGVDLLVAGHDPRLAH